MKKRGIKSALKRALAMGLVGVTALAGITGCGSKNKGDEFITITVFSQRANFNGVQGGWSAKILKEKFNVELLIIPDKEGAYDTRSASGDLGDLCVLGDEQFKRAVENGLLRDIEEDDLLATFGPYIKENEAAALEHSREMTGGKLYGWGFENSTSTTDIQQFIYDWELRWDLYKELGYPEINSLDDYIDMFKKMKEISPTDEAGNPTYAFSLWPDWDGDMVMYVKSFATTYFGYEGDMGLGHYNPENGEWYGTLDDNSPYLQSLKFFNKLYQADLIDPDSMTTTYDVMSEKVKRGGVFASIFKYAGSELYNSEKHYEEGKMYAPMTIANARPVVYGQSVLGGNTYYAIGSKCAYPDRVMEVLNWLCTPEGTMTTYYGPQGMTWDYDENKNTYLTELGKKTVTDNKQEIPEEYGGGIFHDGEIQINCVPWMRDAANPDSNGETYNYKNWKLEQGEAKYEIEADWRKWASEKAGSDIRTSDQYMATANYSVVPNVGWVAEAKTDELKTTWSQVAKEITTGSWKAMYAKTDAEYDKIVADMVKKANEYGYEECQEFSRKQAADRFALQQKVEAENGQTSE